MKYVFPFFACALFFSCFNEGDCLITATNQLHIQFKKRANNKLDTLITFNSIEVSGSDSVLVFKSPTAEILLPLDINADVTQFILKRVNTKDNSIVPDTIQVGYVRQARVVSKDCGAFTYYQDLKILETSLDSAQVKIFRPYLLKDPSSIAYSAYALNYQIFY